MRRVRLRKGREHGKLRKRKEHGRLRI